MKAAILGLIGAAALPLLASAQNVCAIAESASLQPVCEETESIQSCKDRIFNLGAEKRPPDEPTAESVLAEVPHLLDLVNTGDSTNAAVNDYLPLLRLLLDNGSLGEDDQKLGFEWSDPLGFGPKIQNKLTVTLERPEIFTPLAEAMRAASLTDELSSLEDDVDARDDLTIGLSLAFASEKYGRDPRLHQKLLEQLIAATDERDPREQLALLTKRKFESANGLNAELGGQPFCSIQNPELRGAYMQLALTEILAGSAAIHAFSERLTATGFYDVLDLVDNQPQISLTALYRSREEAAGPDEFTARLSYERGDRDVNDLRSHCGGTFSAACIASFTGNSGNETGMSASKRLRFNADYTKISRLDFVMPAPGFSYFTEATERLSVTAIFGQDLGAARPDGRRARLDASLGYEDFSDDPLRQNRGIANLTLTYPLMEGFFLTVGAVYATKPEFRGDVDKEIGARAGITYKISEE